MRILFLLTALFFSPAAMAAPLKVVTSFAILADITQNVAKDTAAVTTLCGVGCDPHEFTPTPGAMASLKNADIIVVNGLGFEGWLTRAIEASQSKAAIITASNGITPLRHDGTADPHAWQNVTLTKQYVDNIATGLKAKGADAAIIDANATAYKTSLDALEARIKAAIAAIPPEKRTVVSTHAAFGYFEAAYGLAFLSPKGLSSESEPSPKAMAELVRFIKTNHVTGLFGESAENNALLNTLSQEAGVPVGGILYGDVLTATDGPAPSYIAMMNSNASVLMSVLKK